MKSLLYHTIVIFCLVTFLNLDLRYVRLDGIRSSTYCEIINFRGAQFSWIHENGYIRGDVISWVGWLV